MNCPSCYSEILEKKEFYNEYTLYKCALCEVQFWTPLQHPGKEFYETSELHHIEGEKTLQWRHKQFFKNSPIKNGILLDIACGTGEFLDAAKKKGFEVWGIDLSERQIEAAKEFYGLERVFAITLDKFVARKNIPRFDVITFFEVLEHLDDPHTFFQELKKILSPKGIIVFSVPNANRVGVGKEPEEAPPNHLFRWNKNALVKLLEAKGFRIVKVIEQPFTRDFFFIRGILSFGLMKFLRVKSGKIVKRGFGPVQVADRENKELSKLIKIFEVLARVKNFLLNIITIPIEILFRLLGVKYWDLYIIAKYEDRNLSSLPK